jgi:hypothetical protein
LRKKPLGGSGLGVYRLENRNRARDDETHHAGSPDIL